MKKYITDMRLTLQHIIQYVTSLVISRLPIFIIVASIILMFLLLYLNKYTYLIYGTLILIPIILISIIVSYNSRLIQQNPAKLLEFKYIRQSNHCFHYYKIYFISYCITLVWLLITNSRDIIFIFLLIITALVLFIQIFFDAKQKPKLQLTELILLIGLAIASKFIVHEWNYNSTDMLAFINMMEVTINMGGLPAAPILDLYNNFNFYIIFGSVTKILTNVPIIDNIFICGSIPSLICIILFTYLITKKVTKEYIIQITSAFFIIIIPVVFSYISTVPPRSLLFSLFLLLAFFFFTANRYLYKRVLVILIITMLALISYHHASLFLILLFCCGCGIIPLFFKIKLSMNQKLILLALVFISIIKLYYTYINTLIRLLSTRFIDNLNYIDIVEGAQPLLNQDFSISIFLLFTPAIAMTTIIMGGLYVLLSPKLKSKTDLILKIVGIIFVITIIPGILDAFPTILGSFQIDRFRLYLSIIFAIIMGIGIVVIYNMLTQITKHKLISLILVIGLCTLSFTTTVCVINARDSQMFYNTDFSELRSFDKIELVSYSFTEQNIPAGSSIITDYHASRYFKDIMYYEKTAFQSYICRNDLDAFLTNPKSIYDIINPYVILRKTTLMNYGLIVGTNYSQIKYRVDEETIAQEYISIIYNSKDILILSP